MSGPQWRALKPGEEAPAGRNVRDLPDGRREWLEELEEDEDEPTSFDVAPDLTAIAQLRARLWHEGGYRPVPLLSANDPDPKRAGKAPIHKDWAKRARRNPPEAATTPALEHLTNTGILCDGLRILDADIDNASLAEVGEQLAIEHFGPAPTRRRSNSSRFAMVYRAAEGEPRKRTLVAASHTEKQACKIEILGTGQQVAAYGGHVSGGRLYWLVDPLDLPRDRLPVVTEAQITAFFAAVAPVIGAEAPAKRKPQTAKTGNGATAPALARLAEALALIPAEIADDYDIWIRVGAALHHETGGSDEGMTAWADWAAKSSKFDADETVLRWASFAEGYGNNTTAGAGTIFHLATPYGWHPPDPLDDDGYIAALKADERANADRGGAGARHKRRTDQPPPYAPTDTTELWDPWEDPPPPQWPNRILSAEAEHTLSLVSLRDGIDISTLGMSIVAAGSAAAPKNARLFPYSHRSTGWSVPPIFWLMLLANSGFRKTDLDQIAFAPLRRIHNNLWRPYSEALREWKRASSDERGPKPVEPHSFIVDDITPEKLGDILANTTRGTAMVKDELVSLFEFGRYRNGGGGEAARGFYLSAYEDAPHPVHRVGRDSYNIEHTGLSIFGGIQPDRLANFENLATDGLLQRFAPLRPPPTVAARPEIDIGSGLDKLHRAIAALCRLDGRNYTTTPEGTALIQETERAGFGYATVTDFSAGWPGFCFKLHGTHARLALILHMLETPTAPVIPTEIVERTYRLVHSFVLQHARDFYATNLGANQERLRDIAGWLLTRQDKNPATGQLERIVASDLTNYVKTCRPLGSKGIAEALDPFVTRGWLVPENDYPGNRAWFFDPAIRGLLATRQRAERNRRAAIRAQIDGIAAKRK